MRGGFIVNVIILIVRFCYARQFRVQLTEYREQLPCGVLFPLIGIYPPAKGNALDRVQQFCGVLMTFILRTHGPRPYRLGEYTTVQGEILWNLFNLVDK